MESTSHKSKAWIVILVIIGLIGSFVVGGLTGGIAGWALGRRSAEREIRAFEPVAPERIEPQSPDEALPDGLRERDPMQDWVPSGAVITQVVVDSPAQRAGLQVGDIIVAVDGEPLDSREELAEIIGQHRPGDEVELTVRAMGGRRDPRTVRATLDGTQEDGRERGWLGIEFYYVEAR